MSQTERETNEPANEVLEQLKAGSRIQVVEQGGIATCFVEDSAGRLLRVLELKIEKSSMRNFPESLRNAIASAGYSGEAAKDIFDLAAPTLADFVSKISQQDSNVKALANFFGKEPPAPALGHMESHPAILTGVTLAMQRAGLSLFSPAAFRAAQEIVQEDLESYVIGARARNDAAKARFLSTQVAKIHQAMGKFGVNNTWVSMYEASAEKNGWPSLQTVEGLLTLINEVYLPIAQRLLALPEIASELADVMVENETADPKHELEMKLAGLQEILDKSRQASRGKVQVAVVNADAMIADARAQNSETFIKAARTDGYVAGARIGAVGTAVGETAGNVAASTSALVFRPLDAIERWAKAQDDPKMVAFVLGGFVVAVPIMLATAVGPVILVLGPIGGGAIRQMWKSFRG